ncbi:MAG: type IV secretory system conjugative DNA transfer family protein, partial [Dongiaceae bacterium]
MAPKKPLKEKDKAVRHIQRVVITSVILLIVILPLAFPAAILAERGFNKPTLDWVFGTYLKTLPANVGYWVDVQKQWVASVTRAEGFPPIAILIPPILFLAVLFFGIAANPYEWNPEHMGVSRRARDEDIKPMGLFKGWIVVLGMRSKKFLMFQETLSALCVAPPGTGKTVGIVVPTILTCNNVSMVINDVKPELADLTSGYRSKYSTVLRLE